MPDLRGLGLSFEIIAVDEDSADNSHAVLALLRGEVPELRVTHASARGRGMPSYAVCRGEILRSISPTVSNSPRRSSAPGTPKKRFICRAIRCPLRAPTYARGWMAF